MGVVERQSEKRAQDRRDRTKANENGRASKVSFGDMRFVDLKLNPMEQGVYDAQPLTPDELLGGLHHLAFEGYKVSVTYDGKNSCFIVSFSCSLQDRTNSGMVLVTRGRDLIDAVGLGLYKHYTVLNEVWEQEGLSRKELDRG